MTNSDSSSQFPYWYPIRGKFVVRNISKDKNKTIRIFDYPILQGQTRDILRIPAISEADIRNSLLKGTLRNKLIAQEIEIVDSDIDLLQFNEEQKSFLKQAGINNGLDVGLDVGLNQLTTEVVNIIESGSVGTLLNRREQQTLIGVIDSNNRIYHIPTDSRTGTNTFLFDEDHLIQVYKNGVRQYYLDDYIIAESQGVGRGYDLVIFTIPPSIVDSISDILTADYWIPTP